MSEPYIAKNYMATSLVTFTPDMDIYEAAALLIDNRISGAPVVNEKGKIVGLLSEQDCLKVILNRGMHDLPSGTVSDFMSPKECIVSVTPDTGIFEIAEMFVKYKFRRFPVVEYGNLVGLISKRDLLSAIKDMRKSFKKS